MLYQAFKWSSYTDIFALKLSLIGDGLVHFIFGDGLVYKSFLFVVGFKIYDLLLVNWDPSFYCNGKYNAYSTESDMDPE